MTQPQGPVYVCLDAAIQEQPIDPALALPELPRFQPPSPADPPHEALAAAAELLGKAQHPVIMVGRVARTHPEWEQRIELAERLGAYVISDIKTGATFPTTHKLHPYPPELYVTDEAGALIREADVLLSLDWVDLGGTLRQACRGTLPNARIIQCSLDQYSHNGYSMDYQALPPTDISILAAPDRLVAGLLSILPADRRPPPPPRTPREDTGPDENEGRLTVRGMAKVTTALLATHNPSYIRLPLSWPGECSRFEDPLDYIGFDGGGGIGSGPGMAVGAALALQRTDRLPVAILGDGDFLMGVTALWTAVHERVPLLVLIANNQSFFNDELHQERVARVRGRPVENRSIGLRMSDPPMDLAMMARGQGAVGFGPIRSLSELSTALEDAVQQTRAGAVCVLDVHVAPEYGRALSSTLLRQIPSAT